MRGCRRRAKKMRQAESWKKDVKDEYFQNLQQISSFQQMLGSRAYNLMPIRML